MPLNDLAQRAKRKAREVTSGSSVAADRRRKYQDARYQAEADRARQEARREGQKEAREELRQRVAERERERAKKEALQKSKGAAHGGGFTGTLRAIASDMNEGGGGTGGGGGNSKPSMFGSSSSREGDLMSEAWPLDTDDDNRADELLVGVDLDRNGSLDDDEFFRLDGSDTVEQEVAQLFDMSSVGNNGSSNWSPSPSGGGGNNSQKSLEEEFADIEDEFSSDDWW